MLPSQRCMPTTTSTSTRCFKIQKRQLRAAPAYSSSLGMTLFPPFWGDVVLFSFLELTLQVLWSSRVRHKTSIVIAFLLDYYPMLLVSFCNSRIYSIEHWPTPLIRCTHHVLLGNEPSPPWQFGDAGTFWFFSHWAGLFARILNAWTGPSNSSAKAAFTNRCRCSGDFTSSNFADTTTTLKCVSEFLGLVANENEKQWKLWAVGSSYAHEQHAKKQKTLLHVVHVRFVDYLQMIGFKKFFQFSPDWAFHWKSMTFWSTHGTYRLSDEQLASSVHSIGSSSTPERLRSRLRLEFDAYSY